MKDRDFASFNIAYAAAYGGYLESEEALSVILLG